MATVTSLGSMLALFPLQLIIGLLAYGIAYLFLRNSSNSLTVGCIAMVIMLINAGEWILLIYAAGVFILIPIKKIADLPRRRHTEELATRAHYRK